MDVTITPRPLRGSVTPPPSKSQAHRLLLAAALSDGVSLVSNVAFSQDIRATLSCVEALGASWEEISPGCLRITGLMGPGGRPRRPFGQLPHLHCGESGSTLRFLIPVALAVAGGGIFTGRGRLMERPQEPYRDLFLQRGIRWEQRDGVLTVEGRLEPGTYALPGDVSSQFVTGLLYALPLLSGESLLESTTPLESEGYISMTLEALDAFGVVAAERREGLPAFRIRPSAYVSRSCRVEADWSQAAFWYAAQGLGCRLDVDGLDPASTQGDRRIFPYSLRLRSPGPVELDVSQCPDLVPALAAQAALRAGETTRIVNAARLRIKESDRLSAVTAALGGLGAQIEEGPDSLTIHGVSALRGGTAESFNDHRIAMMLAVAATRAEGPVTVRGAECVAKSYPNFWEDYEALGGQIVRSN